MTTQSPHRYHVKLAWKGASQGELSALPRPNIWGGPPPDFGGQEQWWSPEHLLLSAASLCLMATFSSFATKEKLQVIDYQCESDGVVEKTNQGLVFTSVSLFVKLIVLPEDVERARKILLTAKQYCIVSNSLKVPVVLRDEVIGGQVSSLPDAEC